MSAAVRLDTAGWLVYVAREYHGYHDVAARAAFLIGTDGTVRGAWRYADGEVPDFDELLAAARAL